MWAVLDMVSLLVFPHQPADYCVVTAQLTSSGFEGHSCSMHPNNLPSLGLCQPLSYHLPLHWLSFVKTGSGDKILLAEQTSFFANVWVTCCTCTPQHDYPPHCRPTGFILFMEHHFWHKWILLVPCLLQWIVTAYCVCGCFTFFVVYINAQVETDRVALRHRGLRLSFTRSNIHYASRHTKRKLLSHWW